MTEKSSSVSAQIDSKGLAVLTLGDAAVKVTVLTHELIDNLEKEIARLESNPSVKGLVIRGCRDEMFAAGADIESIRDVTDSAEGEKLARKGQMIFHRISKLPFPTVAAIGGPCLGGGFELALACRYRVGSDHEKTRIGLPEVKLGILPGFGGTQRLPRLIGMPGALQAILTGRMYEPIPAMKAGLIDEVVPVAYLLQYAGALALGQISKSPRNGFRAWFEGNPLLRSFAASQARKQVQKETKGKYPAPLAAIDSVVFGLGSGLERGLENEARLLGKLIVSPESKSLVHLFFLTEKSKRAASAAENSAPITQAAVVGAGVMGAGIAIAMVDKGITTRLRDLNPDFVSKGIEQARGFFKSRVKKKRLSATEMQANLDRLIPAITPASLKPAELVIEAVAEKIEIKNAVFRQVASELSSDSILATNTSSLSVSQMQKELPHPQRVVGIHFFNPVDKMPLVEIVRGEKTDSLVVARSAALAVRLGKFPVVVKDSPGFLVNRILAPYLNEAAHLLGEGVPMREIDAAAESFGMPMGPITLLDEVGLDIASSAGKTMLAAFGDRMKAPSHLDRLLEAGRKGKKSGAGFYLHQKGKRLDDPQVGKILGLSAQRKISREEIIDRLVLPIVNEALRCLEEKVADSADDVDLGSVMGFGFAPFRGGVLRFAEAEGFSKIHEKLNKFKNNLGSRFSPCQLLESLSQQKSKLPRHS